MKLFRSSAQKFLIGLLEIVPGFVIFCLFLWLGACLKRTFALILPANVLGMLLLLVAITAKIIKLRWIEPAGKWLLLFMPLLFVPIYAGAGAHKKIWIDWVWLLVPTLVATVIAMWAFTGHLTQFIHRRLKK